MATDKKIYWIPYVAGTSLTFDVGGYAIHPDTLENAFAVPERNVVLTVVGTGNVVVYGSAQELPPDFSVASTITNSYVPIMLADYTTPSTYYAGGAGVTVAGTTAIVELNTNMITWIGIERSANTVEVLVTVTDNE